MQEEPILVLPTGRGCFSVRLAGDVDVDEATVLFDVLVPLAGGGADVDVDLGDVTFLGSSGLRALAAAVRAAEPSGARVQVVAASRIVRRVLEVSGMAMLLNAAVPGELSDHLLGQARRMRSAQN